MNNLLILCPNCKEMSEVEKGIDDIDIKTPCDCVAEGEMSVIEWVEMILKNWDDLTILKGYTYPAS